MRTHLSRYWSGVEFELILIQIDRHVHLLTLAVAKRLERADVNDRDPIAFETARWTWPLKTRYCQPRTLAVCPIFFNGTCRRGSRADTVR
jgi:hypothetical protein